MAAQSAGTGDDDQQNIRKELAELREMNKKLQEHMQFMSQLLSGGMYPAMNPFYHQHYHHYPHHLHQHHQHHQHHHHHHHHHHQQHHQHHQHLRHHHHQHHTPFSPPSSAPPAVEPAKPAPAKPTEPLELPQMTTSSEKGAEAPGSKGRGGASQDPAERKRRGRTTSRGGQMTSPPGETLQKLSRTPSRPAERPTEPLQGMEPPPPPKPIPNLPPPVDTRKHLHTPDVAKKLRERLSERDREAASDGLIPPLWRPPDDSVWKRYTASFGITEGMAGTAEYYDDTEGQVQCIGDTAPSSGLVGFQRMWLAFQLLQSDENSRLYQSPASLSALMKALTLCTDTDLKKMVSTLERGSRFTMEVFVRAITVLVWYSPDAVGDVLEVIIRILIRPGAHAPAVMGQQWLPELLDVTSRLAVCLDPPSALVTDGDAVPCLLKPAAARVQTLAQKLHKWLYAKLYFDDTKEAKTPESKKLRQS